jgi:hypothetical protein
MMQAAWAADSIRISSAAQAAMWTVRRAKLLTESLQNLLDGPGVVAIRVIK